MFSSIDDGVALKLAGVLQDRTENRRMTAAKVVRTKLLKAIVCSLFEPWPKCSSFH